MQQYLDLMKGDFESETPQHKAKKKEPLNLSGGRKRNADGTYAKSEKKE